MNYKEELKKNINDLKSIKTFYRQIPNILTITRGIGIIPINILYFLGNIKGAIITCLFVFITDFFDGKIARKYNLISDFGAKLDALCDKLMYFGLSIPLLVNTPQIIPNFILEGLISINNIIKYKKGIDIKTNFPGKVKTWFLSISLVLGYASLYIDYPKIILYTSIITTLISQIITLNKYYHVSDNKASKDYKIEKKDINLEKEDKKELSYKYVYTPSNNELLDKNSYQLSSKTKKR